MNRHFKHEMRDEDIGKMGLMNHAVVPMMRNPEEADEIVRQWDQAKKSNSVEIPTYLGHVYLVCACCVQSVILHDAGKLNEAWVKIMDAQIYSGIALSMYVSKSEVKHKRVKVAKSGGNSRGKKNEMLKKFVLAEWITGGRNKAYPSANAIAEKFHSQNGKPPERTLREFNSGLSISNIEKTFEVWIGEELAKHPIA